MDLLNIDEKNEGRYHFKVNTNRFQIHYRITNIPEGYYPHLGVTAREGIILLYKHPEKKLWTSIDAYHNGNIANVNMSHMLNNNIYYEVLLYAPLLSDVEELTVELNDDASLEIIKESNDRSILLCGGPSSFGIGCTAVSLMFSNILSRKLDVPITNVTYNQEDYMKKLQEHFSNNEDRYDIGIIELNAKENDCLEYDLKEIISQMNSCCNVVIGWYYFKELEPVFKKLLKDEIDNDKIILKDISCIFDENNRDICTYGNNIINDTGNIHIFKILFSTICEVSKWNI